MELIRVMVVDDSAVIRGLLVKMLSTDPAIDVVETASNGLRAINRLEQLDIDLIVLDIEMPVMDGLTAIPKLLALRPDIQIVVASTLTRKNAEISLRCLQAGAADYLAKPSTGSSLLSADDFRRELVEKVKSLGAAQARRRLRRSGTVVRPTVGQDRRPRQPIDKPAPEKAASPSVAPQITLRPGPGATFRPGAIAIGSSTGGPQALHEIFKGLRSARISQPIFVTQHMPPTFTALLAQHLGRSSDRDCQEGASGLKPTGGSVTIAPGDYHMLVEGSPGSPVVRLEQSPQENFCRPSVDPMLRSLVDLYSGNILFVMLTGMGADGLRGTQYLVDAGGVAVAQDEETSVVWGMPGAVAKAGLCTAMLPLSEVGSYIQKVLMRNAA